MSQDQNKAEAFVERMLSILNNGALSEAHRRNRHHDFHRTSDSTF
ncbi:hypothetical protein VB797_17660 [Rivularia sp. UHCC 0363]|nr:hypothetical protein [Rivularia sp. UHCC 0363]MEA5596173.1 hypothetical protein [Rivularia sp. UHCC 0363]